MSRSRATPWIEVAIGLGCYGAYLAARRQVWNETGRERAARNAEAIIGLERRYGIDIERPIQKWAMRFRGAVPVLNAGYAAGNVAVSVGWLFALFHRRDPAYRLERTAAVVAFTASLPAFALFPVAPPRMLDGYDNVGAPNGGGLDDPRLVRFYNPLAAMPSQHVAFATVTGLGLAGRRASRLGRLAWRSYPGVVTLVVLATANHFVADVIAGVGLGLGARRLARRIVA